MKPITKSAIFLWTWVTLVACNSIDPQTNLRNELYKSIIAEKQIFYNPVNKQPVPPLSQSSGTSAKLRGPKVYGSLPCSCEPDQCRCCVDIKFKTLDSDDNGCVIVSPSKVDNNTLDTTILFNNQTMAKSGLSFDDPSPLCSPFPRLPLIAGCVKFNRIRTDKGHLRGCAKLEVRVTGTDAILWDMQFSCFKIGTDGIVFNNPNKNKEKPKPVKESIKEPAKKPMKKPDCH